jgi:hypothetical protein
MARAIRSGDRHIATAPAILERKGLMIDIELGQKQIAADGNRCRTDKSRRYPDPALHFFLSFAYRAKANP